MLLRIDGHLVVRHDGITIAELLDNAVDEVNNGASFVKIDKMKYSPHGEYSLVIQDDGGGMSPEDLRRCMSFGFSHKSTDSSIGQYGNGFKSSTMRLGADVIVFSCRQGNRLTQSIGLLSYTFLTRTGCSDILVPAVDYEFDASSCTLKRIIDHGEKHFSSNLSTLLRWSPFSTENDLLNQFRDIGTHGTKIVVFNLWFNSAGETELDFTTDDKDIIISGAPKIRQEYKEVEMLNHMHIANRFRYSLRVYASILYLHLPEHFKVILCGRVIEPHHIASDLMYRECIKYRPQVGVSTEIDVITTIGFLKGAPKLDVYGFNVYHKNRLILPFWPAGSERSNGRGIAGVLEANFIRPTHDKQDFEKTGLFQRLETRLKDMTREYRKHNGHLIYYTRRATTKTCAGSSSAKASVMLDPCSNGGNSRDPLHVGSSRDQMGYGACSSTPINIPDQTEPCERRNSCSVIDWRAKKRQNTNGYVNQPAGGVNTIELGAWSQILKSECSELEATAQQLLCKADSLTNDLHKWQLVLKGLEDELQFYEVLGTLQHQPGGGRSYVGQRH